MILSLIVFRNNMMLYYLANHSCFAQESLTEDRQTQSESNSSAGLRLVGPKHQIFKIGFHDLRLVSEFVLRILRQVLGL